MVDGCRDKQKLSSSRYPCATRYVACQSRVEKDVYVSALSWTISRGGKLNLNRRSRFLRVSQVLERCRWSINRTTGWSGEKLVGPTKNDLYTYSIDRIDRSGSSLGSTIFCYLFLSIFMKRKKKKKGRKENTTTK